MPGIFGFAQCEKGTFNPKDIAIRMQNLLHYHPNLKTEPIYGDRFVSAGHCMPDIIKKVPEPFTKDGISIWIDGEFYNQPEVCSQFNLKSTTGHELLYELYLSHDFKSALTEIDGIFSAVIYDRPQNSLLLLCDRYGMKHMYVSSDNRSIGWASEIKALTAIPWVSKEIDKKTLENFLHYGYFIEDDTWFGSVKLIQPAGLIKFNLSNGSIERSIYWAWDQIRPVSGKIDIREAGQEWGRLFTNAVRKRVNQGERAGLTLSGGLDSRAILAAFPDEYGQVQAATFGKKNCLDIDLAQKASTVKKARHHVFELSSQNWLQSRLLGVWITDGQLSILDMHGIECLQSISEIFNINLNGLGGDGIHGGSFLSSVKQHFPDTTDPYGSRGRRFIRVGTMLDELWIHNRFPFYDNDLLTFTLSLPVAMRRNSHFYRNALLLTFPDYFKTIPWQKIGIPISAPELVIRMRVLLSRILNRLTFKSGWFGFLRDRKKDYTDYASWLRVEPARSFFKNLLFSPDAIYPDYIDKKQVEKLWSQHDYGTDNSSFLCRYAAIEIWMRQILKNELIPCFELRDRVSNNEVKAI